MLHQSRVLACPWVWADSHYHAEHSPFPTQSCICTCPLPMDLWHAHPSCVDDAVVQQLPLLTTGTTMATGGVISGGPPATSSTAPPVIQSPSAPTHCSGRHIVLIILLIILAILIHCFGCSHAPTAFVPSNSITTWHILLPAPSHPLVTTGDVSSDTIRADDQPVGFPHVLANLIIAEQACISDIHSGAHHDPPTPGYSMNGMSTHFHAPYGGAEKQLPHVLSSTDAVCVVLSTALQDGLWLASFFACLESPLTLPLCLFASNASAIALFEGAVSHIHKH